MKEGNSLNEWKKQSKLATQTFIPMLFEIFYQLRVSPWSLTRFSVSQLKLLNVSMVWRWMKLQLTEDRNFPLVQLSSMHRVLSSPSRIRSNLLETKTQVAERNETSHRRWFLDFNFNFQALFDVAALTFLLSGKMNDTARQSSTRAEKL